MADYDPFEHQAAYIKFVDCRHTVQVTMCQRMPPSEPRITRVNDDFYYVHSTEEFRPYNHGETGTKQDHVRSIKRAFNNLKKLINCNYETPSHVRFVTLTYAENMQDNSRISGDFRRFLRRCKQRYGDFRWLYVKEKQGRGAWHLHCLFFWDSPAPWMDNDEVLGMWGHGFVTIEAVKEDVNNLGNYLCAYMTDDKETGKKGARLMNYEAGVRLYNCSRDVRRPVQRVVSFDEYKRFAESDSHRVLSARDSVVKLPTGLKMHNRYEIYDILHN